MTTGARPSRGVAGQGTTAADIVYESLRDDILDGVFEPGERLVELQLTEMYGVSRTPVREALGRLVTEGMAVRQAGGGIVTGTEPLEVILDTLRIFEVLEGLAARLAVERAGPKSISKLRAALERLEAAVERDDHLALLEETVVFNEILWTMAENDQLVRMLKVVGLSDQRKRHSTLWRHGRGTEVAAQLRAVVDAIEARDADAAETSARVVVGRAREVRRAVEEELAIERSSR